MIASYFALLVSLKENHNACINLKFFKLIRMSLTPLRVVVEEPSTNSFHWRGAISMGADSTGPESIDYKLPKEHSTIKSDKA